MANWTDEELRAALAAYLSIMADPDGETKFSPTALHRSLIAGALSARNEGAIGRRMSNISAVMKQIGEPGIGRYRPSLDHVGAGVTATIVRLLAELKSSAHDAATNANDLRAKATTLRSMGIVPKPPAVTDPPESRSAVGTAFVRSPAVVAWILQNADGRCEGCGAPAPFATLSGIPYLEVHHVRHLAEGGPDTIENAVALCPNCHRRLHHSSDHVAFRSAILKRIGRLIDFPRVFIGRRN